MLEPLGQSQVMSYLKGLSKEHIIHLISFEKTEDWKKNIERSEILRDIQDHNIVWHPLKYHKRPSAFATFWDIFCGSLLGLYLIIRYQLKIVHARSYVPSVMALILKKISRVKYIFDMRGFWADERLDGGLWKRESKLFRVAKHFERLFLLSADHVVSLTYAAVREVEKFQYLKNNLPPMTVIPTCANLDLFKPQDVKQLNDSFTLGYVGSVGTWYLFKEVISAFKQLLEINPNAKFLIVNKGEHEYIQELLRKESLPKESIKLISAKHSEIPQLMSQMDAGIFFIKPTFSKQASAPTKLAEFLGCGIPCLSNSGVGDMALILETNRVGVAIKSFENETIKNGLECLLELKKQSDIQERCRNVALTNFSLKDGTKAYKKIYDGLLKIK
ncbi:glycosyltransferase family 4 protein [Polynucleobacter rarus]|uniref:glycosyltransferase family 4 protein n=1 Tax=Polynucleobacter rarus TaxID=556055 RepID=UPI000D3E64F6|nr:glycosyltransferase family 4 protein [Polynucleobacter rarus]